MKTHPMEPDLAELSRAVFARLEPGENFSKEFVSGFCQTGDNVHGETGPCEVLNNKNDAPAQST
jgi:hypothetical protein